MLSTDLAAILSGYFVLNRVQNEQYFYKVSRNSDNIRNVTSQKIYNVFAFFRSTVVVVVLLLGHVANVVCCQNTKNFYCYCSIPSTIQAAAQNILLHCRQLRMCKGYGSTSKYYIAASTRHLKRRTRKRDNKKEKKHIL